MPPEEQDEQPDPCARTPEQIAEDERRTKRAAEIAKGDNGGASGKDKPGGKSKAK